MKELFTPRRVVISLLLAFAFAGLYVGFTSHDNSANPRLRPREVRFVAPEPGGVVVRQSSITYEVPPEFDGTLLIDGVEIPADQLDVISTGNTRVSFTPGESKEIERLRAGPRVATAVYWPRDQGRASSRSYTWRFKAQ